MLDKHKKGSIDTQDARAWIEFLSACIQNGFSTEPNGKNSVDATDLTLIDKIFDELDLTGTKEFTPIEFYNLIMAFYDRR